MYVSFNSNIAEWTKLPHLRHHISFFVFWTFKLCFDSTDYEKIKIQQMIIMLPEPGSAAAAQYHNRLKSLYWDVVDRPGCMYQWIWFARGIRRGRNFWATLCIHCNYGSISHHLWLGFFNWLFYDANELAYPKYGYTRERALADGHNLTMLEQRPLTFTHSEKYYVSGTHTHTQTGNANDILAVWLIN